MFLLKKYFNKYNEWRKTQVGGWIFSLSAWLWAIFYFVWRPAFDVMSGIYVVIGWFVLLGMLVFGLYKLVQLIAREVSETRKATALSKRNELKNIIREAIREESRFRV